MKFKSAMTVFAAVGFLVTMIASVITPASAQGFWYHRHHHYRHYYRQGVIVNPGVSVWTAPQPGWYYHSHDWYYNHPYAWRQAHPYHLGPHGGFYLQF